MDEPKDLIQSVQDEVARLREMIAETKALFPDANVNFIVYEIAIREAEQAVKYQDTVALARMLPALKEM